MAPQKVLWVIYTDRIIGCNGVNDGCAAGAGEMRQPFPQTIGGLGNAFANKDLVQHNMLLPNLGDDGEILTFNT